MTDRPIIFSAPMVLALIAGRKTQTRRLATSPLRRCEVGDRLYAREAFGVASIFTDVVEVRYQASERGCYTDFVEQVPVAAATGAKVTWPKYRPSIHRPRWASRLTLIIEAVRAEPLQAISEADAVAEGIEFVTETSSGRFYRNYRGGDCPMMAWGSYRSLWESLHGEESWAENPDVVALSFRVVRENIDRIAA